MIGTGSSIASIFACASRKPEIRFDIDRLGVSRFSASSDCGPSDVLELFLARLGDDDCISLRPVALAVFLKLGDGFGEVGWSGEVMGKEGLRIAAVFGFGVGGAEEVSDMLSLFESPFTIVGGACALFTYCAVPAAAMLKRMLAYPLLFRIPCKVFAFVWIVNNYMWLELHVGSLSEGVARLPLANLPFWDGSLCLVSFPDPEPISESQTAK